MSANEKLRSIAYALGLTMTTSQEKAYGEFKGFPLLLTVTSDEELLAHIEQLDEEERAYTQRDSGYEYYSKALHMAEKEYNKESSNIFNH